MGEDEQCIPGYNDIASGGYRFRIIRCQGRRNILALCIHVLVQCELPLKVHVVQKSKKSVFQGGTAVAR